jgi:hypothetical protein
LKTGLPVIIPLKTAKLLVRFQFLAVLNLEKDDLGFERGQFLCYQSYLLLQLSDCDILLAVQDLVSGGSRLKISLGKTIN